MNKLAATLLRQIENYGSLSISDLMKANYRNATASDLFHSIATLEKLGLVIRIKGDPTDIIVRTHRSIDT